MADDRYNWLDKDAAEQLLRGEPVSARDGDGARELEQLLEAAAAVGAKASGTTPLPGEEAALTAFRQAAGRGSGARARGRATAGPSAAVRTAHATDRVGRTRVARPFRRGLVVALAACAIGGVAVAAGSGVLSAPFRDSGDPEPASTVSAAETPGPLDTREPGAQTEGTTAQTPDPTSGGESTGPATPAPGGSPGASRGPGTGTPSGGTGQDDRPGGDGDGGSKNRDKKKLLLTLCRDYESGKRGQMDRDTVRRLERKAGGADKVHAFCRAYLLRYQNGGGTGDNDGFGGNQGGSGQNGGDEDDDEHPSQAPGTTPVPGASTPAPVPSVTATDPATATPSVPATS